MSDVDALRLVDLLAQITHLEDPRDIQMGFLRALVELHQSEALWLYRIVEDEPHPTLSLLAQASGERDGHPCPTPPRIAEDALAPLLLEAVRRDQVSRQVGSGKQAEAYFVYPIRCSRGGGFAVVERVSAVDADSRPMTRGLLRILANYLRLLDKTQRDKLTGVLNRETLAEEITRILIQNQGQREGEVPPQHAVQSDARQHKGMLKSWVGVLDIDHFKRINDTFGHLYGDEILILVARLMEASVRNYDLIFRYGGEEFVILLKAFDLADARQAFERIRTAVGHHDYAKVEQVTVSIGVVEVGHQSGPTEVLGQADEALYYAKRHGRDQVRFHEELLAQGKVRSRDEQIEIGGVNFF